MRTGRLIISRGNQLGEAPLPPRLIAVPAEVAEPVSAPTPLPLYPEIDERLSALERLARLFDQGALSPQEFAAEKALVLGRWGESAPSPVSFAPMERRRPSLLGRLLNWKLLVLGLAAGLAFSFATQPRETAAFFEDLRLLVGV